MDKPLGRRGAREAALVEWAYSQVNLLLEGIGIKVSASTSITFSFFLTNKYSKLISFRLRPCLDPVLRRDSGILRLGLGGLWLYTR